ncbi:MAG TPA: hypothetical protein VIL32_03375 [Steroidobacteraceae bacterium]
MSVEVEREVLIERPVDRFEGMKISWGGVFGGVLAGLGTLLLLSSLGLAVGVSAVDAGGAQGESLGRGAAIWSAVSLLIALFVGGWASTRLSMLWERTTALFEGALVWVLSMMLILYLAANGVGMLSGGMFGDAADSAAAAAPQMETITRSAWGSFAALVLSLIAAVAGAAVGRRSTVRRVETGAPPR